MRSTFRHVISAVSSAGPALAQSLRSAFVGPRVALAGLKQLGLWEEGESEEKSRDLRQTNPPLPASLSAADASAPALPRRRTQDCSGKHHDSRREGARITVLGALEIGSQAK